MGVVNGKGKSKENEKEDDVQILPVFSGHRIPWKVNIRKIEQKSQTQNWAWIPPKAEKPSVP